MTKGAKIFFLTMFLLGILAMVMAFNKYVIKKDFKIISEVNHKSDINNNFFNF